MAIESYMPAAGRQNKKDRTGLMSIDIPPLVRKRPHGSRALDALETRKSPIDTLLCDLTPVLFSALFSISEEEKKRRRHDQQPVEGLVEAG